MDKQYHKIMIMLGDYSCDGHEKDEKIIIDSNYPVEDLRKAYEESCKKTGIKFHEEICSEADDYCLRPEQEDKLRSNGCPLDSLLGPQFEIDKIFCSTTFLRLLMWFIGLSLNDFYWGIVIDPALFNYDMNLGYGLY